MNIKKQIVTRFFLVYFFMLFIAIAIVLRILHLQFVEGTTWENMANTYTQKDIIITPKRGDICAVDGRLLASSVPLYSIYFDTQVPSLTNEAFTQNIDSLALGLSVIFKDNSKYEYKQKLISARNRKSRYYLIRRNCTHNQLLRLKSLPIFRLGKYDGGFIVLSHEKRVKLYADLASRIIGRMGFNSADELVGKVGLEEAYETVLKGHEGRGLMQKLSGGNWMPVDGEYQVEPVDGMSIVSAIDINVQDITHNALLKSLTQHNAEYGVAVVMEVETGEVRAMVNLSRSKSDPMLYVEDYNYAIGSATEPGSTFKLPALMVALEDGVVDLNDSVDTEGGVKKYYTSLMKDSHFGGYGVITVKHAFEVSSNVGISKIITQHYANNERKFVDKLFSMNLNNKLGIEIKGEGKPHIKDPSDRSWSGVTLPWMSIGYSVKMTPLQILAFYNAVANNGEMVRPLFVKGYLNEGKMVKKFDKQVIIPSICSEKTIKKAQAILKGAVENGTASILISEDYTCAGKTGTCQLNYGNKDEKIEYQASFVGYFPADHPKYSCIVVVNKPRNGKYYGSDVAVPVFKEIADKLYASDLNFQPDRQLALLSKNSAPYSRNGNKDDLLEIYKIIKVPVHDMDETAEWVITQNQDSIVRLDRRSVQSDVVPNVHGMGLKDALFLLENIGLRVNVIGFGIVAKQSIEPGVRVKKGDEISIILS